MKLYKTKRDKRRTRIRAKIVGTPSRPRLSVFRSNKCIYVQLIDDQHSKTLLAETSKGEKETGVKAAGIIGKKLGDKAKKNGITHVVFDRGGYKYHGQVKALAEGARMGGLVF